MVFYPLWTWQKKVMMGLVGIAFTWLANVARMLLIALMLHFFGKEALVIAHTFIGKAFFFLATIGIYWFLVTANSLPDIKRKILAGWAANERLFPAVHDILGVCILVPVLVDGLTTLIGLIGYFVFLLKHRKPNPPLKFHPMVSIIIPVKNGAGTLRDCVESIASQDYPIDQLEVVIVDNGSTDNSFKIFQELQSTLKLSLAWNSIEGRGKAWALNAGIHLTSGEYVLGVDCDVVMAGDAVRRIVEAMEADPKVVWSLHRMIMSSPQDLSRFRRIWMHANSSNMQQFSGWGVHRSPSRARCTPFPVPALPSGVKHYCRPSFTTNPQSAKIRI